MREVGMNYRVVIGNDSTAEMYGGGIGCRPRS